MPGTATQTLPDGTPIPPEAVKQIMPPVPPTVTVSNNGPGPVVLHKVDVAGAPNHPAIVLDVGDHFITALVGTNSLIVTAARPT